MFIHNFYSDVALSVRILLDNYVFKAAHKNTATVCCSSKNFIKAYEFNIGNRLFQLGDYNTQYEFPNAIITLNDEAPAFGHRPQVFQQASGDNIDQIPVLYNKTTGTYIYVQEESHYVPLTIQFNCESQLQAKEIEHAVRWALHINKWFQPFGFTSFFELSSMFLDKIDFNPNQHDIVNLYTKMNHERGEIAYMFSIRYTPLIRLDSVTVNIAEPSQRSFQANADMTYLIQMPVHLFSHKPPKVTASIIPTITIGPEPIAAIDPQPIVEPNDSGSPEKDIRRTEMIPDCENGNRCVNVEPIINTCVLPADQNEIICDCGSPYGSPIGSPETITDCCSIKIVRQLPNELIVWVGSERHRVRILPGETKTIQNEADCSCGRIEVIRSETTDEVTVNLIHYQTHFTIHYDIEDFPLSDPNYKFQFWRGGEVYYPDPDTYSIDFIENSVTFIFDRCFFDEELRPSVVNPTYFSIYVDGTGAVRHSLVGWPPDVSLVRVGEITSFSAIVWWTSGNPTNSVIEYGPETGSPVGSITGGEPTYGFFTDGKNMNEGGNFVKTSAPTSNTHKVLLWGLDSGTTYHFRVNTITDEGLAVISGDYTFTTL